MWLLLACTLVLPVVGASAAEPITFGVQMAPETEDVDEVVRTAKLVEVLGYDHFWLNDHFVPILGDKDGPHFESWMLLAAISRETARVRLGILVTGNTYRHPAVLAKMATTVDHLSHGRLNFGIGAGWEEFEHTAYGIPFYTARERSRRLGEALEIITRLWRDDHPSFQGEYYSLVRAPFAPRPVQKPHPPIVIGGQGRQWIMPLVARYADEWNVPVGLSPADVRERLAGIRADCERLRRDPCVRGVSVFLPLANITDIPLAGPATRLGARLLVDERAGVSVLAGSAVEIQSRIREYVEAGATSVIITTRPAINHALMRRFATEIVPALRAGPTSGRSPDR
jgi:F420-dependent oxidoreductase-like protein